MHLTNPDSWHLYHSAIIHSGSLNCPWALATPEEMQSRSRHYADSYFEKKLPYSINGDIERLEKLRSLTPDDLLQLDKCCFAQGICMWPWLPHRSGGWQNFCRSQFNPNCNVYFSFTSSEGSCFLYSHLPEIISDSNKYSKDFLVRKTVQYFPDYPNKPSDDSLVKLTKFYQLNGEDNIRMKLNKLTSDWLFEIPMLYFIRELIRNRETNDKIKGFIFDYRTKVKDAHCYPEWTGVVHGDEISYIFRRPYDNLLIDGRISKPVEFDSEDRSISESLSSLMNYVKSAMTQKAAKEFDWPNFDLKEKKVLLLRNPERGFELHQLGSLYDLKMQFWSNWL